MSIEAMKQALEALEYCKHLAECQRVWGGTEWSYPFPWKRIFDSTTKSLHTIRTAIEQAEKQEPVAWDDLLGAVARGWGHSKNAHKEMDSDLALAIAEEVKSLLKEKNT